MKVKQDYSKLQIQMTQLKKQYQDAVCQRLQLNKQVHVYMCRQYECSRTSLMCMYTHTRSHTHARKQRRTCDTCREFVALSVLVQGYITRKEGTYSFFVKLFCISTGQTVNQTASRVTVKMLLLTSITAPQDTVAWSIHVTMILYVGILNV